MITRRGADIVYGVFLCSRTFGIGELVDIEGNDNAVNVSYNNLNSTIYKTATTTTSGFRLLYGGGDAPESTADYKLDEPLGIMGVSGTCGYGSGNYIVTGTGINTGETAITIKEIGMAAVLQNNQGGQAFLVARKVIPARTVQPNETFTFSMSLDVAGGL